MSIVEIITPDQRFSDYEKRVIDEIALHAVSPGLMRSALELAGKPIEKVLRFAALSPLKSLQKAQEFVQAAVQKGLEASMAAAIRLAPEDKVLSRARNLGLAAPDVMSLGSLPLEQLDALSRSWERRSMAGLGAEGALLGAATTLATGIPFAQLLIPSLIATDVGASMTLLSRHAALVATSYGHSPRVPENRVHLIAAMAPAGETPDEGYMAVKTAAVQSLREAGVFLAKNHTINRMVLEKEAPQLIKLMNYAAERLGIILTEKQLGMLVPIAGAALNGGLNIAFHKIGHQAAQDYYRTLVLEQRHGEQAVRQALETARVTQRSRIHRR